MDLGQGAAALVLPCQQCRRKRLSVTDSTVHVHSDCSLRLSILPLMWYRTISSPACQGPVLQHLTDVQSIPYVISYVNFTTSNLTYTLHRQANSQTLCSGTLTMYIDIPICLSSISVCILAKIGNHLQPNGNTLKDSGLPLSFHKTNSKHSSQAKENHYLTLKIFYCLLLTLVNGNSHFHVVVLPFTNIYSAAAISLVKTLCPGTE